MNLKLVKQHNKINSILVISESFEESNKIRNILKYKNYDIYFSEVIAEDCQVLKNEKFDLIIIDLNSEKTSSLNLFKNIRDNINIDTQLLVISSKHDNEVSYLELGASEVITKPLIAEEFIFKIQNCFCDTKNKLEYSNISL